MNRKVLIILLMCIFLTGFFTACEKDEITQDTDEADSNDSEDDTSAEVVSKDYEFTIADAIQGNCDDHEDADDYTWESLSETTIQLNGTTAVISGSGASVSGSVITIAEAGNYRISGTLTDGRLLVNSSGKESVRLILDGVNISCSDNAPIYIEDAGKTIINLPENKENFLSDGTTYVLADSTDEPNAALFSKSDLTIFGDGTLTINAKYKDGISTKDGLILASGNIMVTAADDGIRGKDYLIVKNGNFTISSAGDGLKSDNDSDTTKGYILLQSGTLDITSGGDALNAQTDALIQSADVTIKSGGGSNIALAETESAKAIKGDVNVIIEGNTFNINSADDAIHSNGSVAINGGYFTISSGDDAFHADSLLTINNGNINISKSYEGLESAMLTLNGGSIHIEASDDGINGAGGNDGSGTVMGPGIDPFASSGDYSLTVNGGYVYLNANGDGIDINGFIVMTGGTVIVNGPTDNGNAAVDFDATCKISGGFLVAAGSSAMALAASTTSTQNSLLLNLTSSRSAGTLIRIQQSDTSDVLTFSPAKTYQSILFTSPDFYSGTTYSVYLGGSATGTVTDGLYADESYTDGTEYTSFTVTGTVTKLGSSSMGPGW